MERYTLLRGQNLFWTCRDNESGLEISFLEGMFNDTQRINADNLHGIESPLQVPRLLTGMADWLAENYRCLVECNEDARAFAIRHLNVEAYWILMADLLNGHVLTDSDNNTALRAVMEDADESIYEKYELDPDTAIEVVSYLSADEAHEVFRIVDTFWRMQEEFSIDARAWARDVTWWPAFIPQDEDREPQTVEDFGRELCETRKDMEISLQELSHRSGVDIGLISKIENGKANPTLQNLLKIANAMGLSLFFGE